MTYLIRTLLLLILIFSEVSLANNSYNEEELKSLQIFAEAFYRIKNDYVEKKDSKKIIEAAMHGMLSSLDPHSSYLDKRAFEEMRNYIKGNFGGIGTELFSENGLIKIMTVLEDTPAFKAGLKNGDYIIMIDGEHVNNMGFGEAAQKIRGKKGSAVNLTIFRENNKDPIEFKIVRDTINIVSVKSRVETENIAYIKINTFGEKTGSEVKQNLEQLKEKIGKNLIGIILDLRNNPGGSLDQAIAVSDLFLDKGEIVSIRGRNKDNITRYRAKGNNISNKIPIIVLINEGSASAAEIVAGALQDHKRAVIMGTESFGKGTVQTILPLPEDNGAMRMTTARYYTPSGRSIQAEGIKPDVNVEQIQLKSDIFKKKNSFKEANFANHLTKELIIEDAKNQVMKTIEKSIITNEGKKNNIIEDYQLFRAIDMLQVINNLGLERVNK